jgi:5-methylthioribose kinase
MNIHVQSLTLDFNGSKLRIMDQRHLPQECRWITVRDVDHMIELIRSLAIRGAPLIGVAAALELARCARHHSQEPAFIRSEALRLREARPTAVNLAAAIDRMLRENPKCESEGLLRSALAIFDQDVAMCASMARHGTPLIADGDGVLTICNSGALATAGIGSALGVILQAASEGKRIHVYACETRPLLQGARLTAWELARAEVPYSLICDSMAATLMASGRIQKVFVGADRIASNGDFANKIGTYSLAVLAKHHQIPFYAVAPTSTVDPCCPTGDSIPIEERDGNEVRGASGAFGSVTWASPNAPVVNPAFDVTPATLVSGIVLESGLMELKPARPQNHDRASLQTFLAGIPRACEILGGDPEQWSALELGDGNVNMLYRVSGELGSVMVKQAVPYLRCAGDSWPLSIERVRFETLALGAFRALAPDYVPEVIHFSAACSSLVMEYLQPHGILRKGLIQGITYPHLAKHLADYLSKVLIGTSEVVMSSLEKRRLMAIFCGNTDLCKITEDLIFTDPYRRASHNRWTTPALDDLAAAFRADKEAKIAIVELKRRFLSSAEALIHGDFHTGSIMVTRESTKVIDPEFAVYGPMGFDTGLLLGNLLLAYFSQTGHESFEGERADYQRWILSLILDTWTTFSERFHQRWQEDHQGERVGADVMSSTELRSSIPRMAGDDLDRVFSDTLGFAAAEMIRRILGLAHVEDMEAIADPEVRARCERQALDMARDLLVHRGHYHDMDEVIARAVVVSSQTSQHPHHSQHAQQVHHG